MLLCFGKKIKIFGWFWVKRWINLLKFFVQNFDVFNSVGKALRQAQDRLRHFYFFMLGKEAKQIQGLFAFSQKFGFGLRGVLFHIFL
jgi:hypothetical protein